MTTHSSLTSMAALALSSAHLLATPPRYDHVVIVVEENRAQNQIIGDLANAPYLNALAAGGVSMARMFAIEHPSQPNYLQLFAGANQGTTGDGLPPNFSTTPTATYPFRTPNLGAALIDAGFTFAGYSEGLETAGTANWADYNPLATTHPGVAYRRKHNPWANWIAKQTPRPANQLDPSLNKAFTQFPADFTQLSTLSFVVPDQNHDMHDGTRLEGDTWLAQNLGAFATWAKTHNSLLIVTWDEDDFNATNQIPTIFHGAGLRDGTVTQGTWTLHHLLRTLEDMYGLTSHAGSAALVRSIVGPFACDPEVMVKEFRRGLEGYTAMQDTLLWKNTPTTSYAASASLTASLDTGGSQMGHALLRFDELFGTATGQIPPQAIIHSAKLILFTPANTGTNNFNSNSTFRAHRMIADWNQASTWSSLAGGVAINDVEAAAAPTFALVPDVDGAPAIFDVTSDLEMFQDGTPNRGWVIRAISSSTVDSWTFYSADYAISAATRPTLEVVYSLPVYDQWAAAHALAPNDAPEADPDLDGASNVVEFACNMNPAVPDATPVTAEGTSGLPAVQLVFEGDSPLLELTFLRRRSAASGLAYAAEFSADLATWSTSAVVEATVIDSDWERVTARDDAAAADRFGRVRITLTR